MSDWRGRILDSTRGRVVGLLRRGERTVGDLAAELELTNNAVRLHLSALERDGLVEPCGQRREWTGKPAVLYRATVAAEALFPKPYGAVLSALLSELEQTSDAGEVEALLRRAGARLGAGAGARGQSLEDRVAHAATVLNGLGGLAEVELQPDGYLIRGYSCPLADLVREHPAACSAATSLVSELVGASVRACCAHGDRPRCAFHVTNS